MSELHDDLLNYEIGDVDDTDLTGADEDELLLSDDEDFPCQTYQEQKENLVVSGVRGNNSVKECKQIIIDADDEIANKSDENTPQSINETISATEIKIPKCVVSVPIPQQQANQKQKLSDEVKLIGFATQQEVSSKNKKDEKNLLQSTVLPLASAELKSNKSCEPVRCVQETKTDSNGDLNEFISNEKCDLVVFESTVAYDQETELPQVAIEGTKLPQDTVEEAQLRQEAIEETQLPQIASEGTQSPQVAIEGTKLPQDTVEEAQLPQIGVEGTQSPQVAIEETKLPQETVEEAQFIQETAEVTQLPQETIEETKLPQVAIDGTKLPQDTVEEAQLPQEANEETQLPQIGVEGTQSPQVAIEETKLPQEIREGAQLIQETAEVTQLPQEAIEETKLPQETVEEAQLLQEANEETQLPQMAIEGAQSPQVVIEETKLPQETVEEAQLPQEANEETQLPQIGVEGTQSPQVAIEETKLPQETVEEAQLIQETAEVTQLPQETIEETKLPQVAIEGTKLPQDTVEEAQLPQEANEETQLPQIGVEGTQSPQVAIEETKLPQETVEEAQLIQETAEVTQLPQETIEETKLPQVAIEGTKLPQDTVEEAQLPQEANEETQLPQIGVEGTQSPQVAIEETKLPQEIREGAQLIQETAEVTQLPQEAIEETKLPQDTVEEAQLWQEAIEETRLPQIASEGTQSPQVAIEGTKLPQDTVEEAQLPQIGVEGTQSPQVAIEGTKLPQDTVEEAQLPQIGVEGTQSPQVAIEETKLPQETVEEAQLIQETAEVTQLPQEAIEETKLPQETVEEAQLLQEANEETQLPQMAIEGAQSPQVASEGTKLPQVTVEVNSVENGLTSATIDFEPDDANEVRERQNPKTCVERESQQQMQHEENKSKSSNSMHVQRNRCIRPSILRQHHHPYPMPPSKNFNPLFMAQFCGQMPINRRPLPLGPPADFLRNHPMSMRRPGQIHRMPTPRHCMPPHPRLPPLPHQLGPNNRPHSGLPHRIQRPSFHPQPAPGMFGNNQGMPSSQGMLRPRLSAPNSHQLRSPRPPFRPFVQQTTNPGNAIFQRAPMHQQPPSIPNRNCHSAGMSGQTTAIPVPSVARKVLINPNFKGGVQAATNQLMMDAIKNSQLMENDKEAELLRQQEAFINQNRIHIEKRRRSREYSPISRERSYFPPIRRRKHPRKLNSTYMENMNRGRDRANSSRESEFEPKRRRSGSFDASSFDKKDQKTDEDEETRAYRLEIEKQKAMREKILQDKEMRRRNAAKVKKKAEERKVADALIQKLTPIIVTAKKIISLKKTATESIKSNSPGDQLQMKQTIVLAAKTQTTSGCELIENEVKVRRKSKLLNSLSGNTLTNDDDDEDKLITDFLQPPSTKSKNLVRTDTDACSNSVKVSKIRSILTNRRVVFRNSGDAPNKDNLGEKTIISSITADGHKGIIDRFDRTKVFNEAAK